MSGYASTTKVSVAKSKMQMEELLTKHGATGFAAMWDDDLSMHACLFKLPAGDGGSRQIRISIPVPQKEDFRRTEVKRLVRSDEETLRAWEQACRVSWRAMFLLVKAKLVGIEEGATTFEEEFLPHFVMQDGRTLMETVGPDLPKALDGHGPLRLGGGA